MLLAELLRLHQEAVLLEWCQWCRRLLLHLLHLVV
jgi:hypothetical protein